MSTFDIIIISCGKSAKHTALTQNAINTCLASEPDLPKDFFNIVVVETCNQDIRYTGVNKYIWFPQTEFNYHRSINKAIQETSSPYVAWCNNDLIFHTNWASNLLRVFQQTNIKSLSPVSYAGHQHSGHNKGANTYAKGWQIGTYIAGWCIVADRKLFDIVKSKKGILDERVDFFYSDNIYGRHLLKHKQDHAIVMNSRVDHIEGGEKTWKTEKCAAKQRRLTTLQKRKYEQACRDL